MSAQFLAETLSRKPQLFSAILAFNKELHRTDLPDDLSKLGSAGELLWQDRSFRLAYPEDSKQKMFWDFADESHRLILLDDTSLYTLGIYFGAAVYGEEIARRIDQKTVSRLHGTIGKTAYSYALTRGRFQIGSLRSFLVAMNRELPIEHRILVLAQSALIIPAATLPEKEIRIRHLERIIRLFHTDPEPDSVAPMTLPQFSHEQTKTLWFTLKKLLLKEVAPQWAPCFD